MLSKSRWIDPERVERFGGYLKSRKDLLAIDAPSGFTFGLPLIASCKNRDAYREPAEYSCFGRVACKTRVIDAVLTLHVFGAGVTFACPCQRAVRMTLSIPTPPV